MPATLNITLEGISSNYTAELGPAITDGDVKHLAVEVIRNGEVPGLHRPQLPANAFENYVVDRFRGPEGDDRLYLRPKVPFGVSR